VMARSPDGAVIGFDEVKKGGTLTPRDYLSRLNVRLSEAEDITINGLRAATGAARVQTSGGERNLRVVVIRFSPEHLFRFIFLTPVQLSASLDEALKRTTYSFRPLSAAEATALKPYRIRVMRVHAGDTVRSLSLLMPFPDHREERFRVLNGLGPSDGLPPDGLVKVVVEGDVPKSIL
jgi:predicted Zn-dependent protease